MARGFPFAAHRGDCQVEDTLLALFKSRTRPEGTTAVAFEPSGFALAHVARRDGARPALAVCEFVTASTPADVDAELAHAVRRHHLQDTATVCVPDPRAYSLCQLEAPEVEPDELADAVRWSIQDLVDFDVSDAVVDAFELQGSEVRGRSRQVCAVAAPLDAIRSLVHGVRQAGLELLAIDIVELSLRNLAARVRGADKGVAFVFLRGGQGHITITRGDALYLMRHLELDTEPLEGGLDLPADDALAPGGAWAATLDELVLELQRSLDFYEHLLGQDPIGSVALAPTEAGSDALLAAIAKNLPVDVERFDVNDLFECAEPVPIETQARCLVAVGAALRVEAST